MAEQRSSAKGMHSATVKRYDKSKLFGTDREIIIEYAGKDYRLRETKNGKLILNL